MLDDSRWPEASGLIDELCGTKGNLLMFGDGAEHEDLDIVFTRFCLRGRRRADLERQYIQILRAVHARLQPARGLRDSPMVPVHSLFTDKEMRTSRVCNDLLPSTESRNGLIVRLDEPDGLWIVWAVADPVDGDGWSAARVETIQRLLPHLRQFVRIRQTLANAMALGASAVDILDDISASVIQLDRRGRVVAASDRARALLRAGDGLWNRDGRLQASLPGERVKVQRLMERALPLLGGPRASGSVVVRRSASEPFLLMHVRPMCDGEVGLRARRAGALVLVIDPTDRVSIDPRQVAAVLGLTPAESRVAVSLAQGKTIGDIAAATGRSPTTVRWHVKHIFAKHGLSRQVELVKLVMSVAGVPAPRRYRPETVADGSAFGPSPPSA